MNLVGLMGGRIRVRSRAGEGSVFEFPITWEVVRTSEAVATGADTTLDPGFAVRHPLRILLVEDNPVNQIVAKQIADAARLRGRAGRRRRVRRPVVTREDRYDRRFLARPRGVLAQRIQDTAPRP